MTRIVAGTRGGRRIVAPPGRDTRPTADRVREALFSTLESMVGMVGRHFVDLYAGSGAVGIEAASRGAAAVLLVESDVKAARAVRANIAALDLAAVCRLEVARVASVVATRPEQRYDVVFVDPPYQTPSGEVDAVLATLADQEWLAPGAVVVVERATRSPGPIWPPTVTADHARRYGETTLWYGRRE